MQAASPAQGLGRSSSEWSSAGSWRSHNPRLCFQDGSLPRAAPAVLISQARHSGSSDKFSTASKSSSNSRSSSGTSSRAGKALQTRRPSRARPSRGHPGNAAVGGSAEGGSSGSPTPSDGDRSTPQGSGSGGGGASVPVSSASVSALPMPEEQASWSVRHSQGSIIVHPTALVHPDAVLMEGVEVGPFCTVGPLARLGRGCKLQTSSHVQGDTVLGDHCTLYTGAVVGSDLPGWTRLGSHNKVGNYALVGIRCQDMKYKEGTACNLEIGSHNDIREHTQIHRSSREDDITTIGDHNLIMGACHVAHDCKLGHRNILANNTLLAGHVVLHDFVHTGGAVAVHQFCHVDSYSFLAGGAMVTRDVPMYTMVSGDRAELRGLNLEGLRRSGFSTDEVRDIRKAYQKLFMSTDELVGFEERLASLEDSSLGKQPRVKALVESIRGSFQEKRRGICKFRHWSSADGV